MNIPFGDDEHGFIERVTIAGREGKTVFLRSVGLDEVKVKKAHVNAGEEGKIRAGDLIINSREFDIYHTCKLESVGGYIPISPTINAWPFRGKDVRAFLHFLSTARKIDLAHALWAQSIQSLEKARREKSPIREAEAFISLGKAEASIISLNRGLEMLWNLNSSGYCQISTPKTVSNMKPAIKSMRDAFEHINDRASGMTGARSRVDIQTAYSIFDQSDFVDSGVIVYGEYSLEFERGVLLLLLDCRKYLMDVLESRAEVDVPNNDEDQKKAP